MAEVDSKELKDFISSAINSIKSGLSEQDHVVALGVIEFELAVVKTKRKGAGFNIHVVDASAKYDKEVVSKIKFKAAPKGSDFDR